MERDGAVEIERAEPAQDEAGRHSLDRAARAIGRGDVDAAQIERPRQALGPVALAPALRRRRAAPGGRAPGDRAGPTAQRHWRAAGRAPRPAARRSRQGLPPMRSRKRFGRGEERRAVARGKRAKPVAEMAVDGSDGETVRRARPAASRAAVVVMPASGTPSATASPRAAARPTRTPVKLPGPTVTAISDSARRSTPACCSDAAIAGSSVAAWSRPSSRWCARQRAASSRTTATLRPLTAQSKARIGHPLALPEAAGHCCGMKLDLVEIAPPDFDVDVTLAYATDANLTGQPVYRNAECWLQREAAETLHGGDRARPAARPAPADLRRAAAGRGAMGAVERQARSGIPRRPAARLAAFARRCGRSHAARRRRPRARHGHRLRCLHAAVASRPHRRLGRGAAQPAAADGPDDRRPAGISIATNGGTISCSTRGAIR